MKRINLQVQGNPESVATEQVSFTSGHSNLAGTLYLPRAARNNPGAKGIQGVVVAGAWTTVKEQMAGTYARESASRGYAALAFDFTGWGKSEGSPRYVEDPAIKTADIQAARGYLATRRDIDSDKIHGLGICASAGYVVHVGANGAFASVALVAPWLHNEELATQVYGGDAVAAKLLKSSQDAAANEEGDVITAASTTDENTPMYNAPYYTETDRGLISAYDNKFNLLTWQPWLTYDAFQSANRLTVPLLMVGSDAMALPPGAEQYEARLQRAPQKLWLDDVNQFDFYDRADVVEQAADAVAAHFSA